MNATTPQQNKENQQTKNICLSLKFVLEKVDYLAELEAIDVGKPLKQAKADAIALGRYLEFYGGAADKIHGETTSKYLESFSTPRVRVLCERKPGSLTSTVESSI